MAAATSRSHPAPPGPDSVRTDHALLATSWLLALGVALATPAVGWSQTDCGHPGRAPRLDHAIAVVRSLDSARARFAALGFRFKPGRLHPNNLVNLHIKLRSGSELELMSLAGRPGDAGARDYARLLAAGPGGAYAALTARDLDAVAEAARHAGLEYRRTTGGRWRFVSFPGSREAGAVFFGTGWLSAQDPDSVLDHPNGTTTLEQVWVEGGPRLETLLESLGAAPCDSVRLPDGRMGRSWGLSSGSIVVIRPHSRSTLPRLTGVRLAGPAVQKESLWSPLPGFWVGLSRLPEASGE